MNQRIDKPGFIATIAVMLLMTVPLMMAPELSSKVMQQAYEYIGSNFGFLYVFLATTILPLLLWLAFGKYGSIKLGDADDKPEYNNFAWSGMLFCAGVGAGLLY